MKFIIKVMLVVTTSICLNSCAQFLFEKTMKSKHEMGEFKVLGQARAKYPFNVSAFEYKTKQDTLHAEKQAYSMLLRAARKKYDSEDIDVDDIDIINIRVYFSSFGHKATCDVILRNQKDMLRDETTAIP
jgi:hypothetical protein